jgi:hypothetical protein
MNKMRLFPKTNSDFSNFLTGMAKKSIIYTENLTNNTI